MKVYLIYVRIKITDYQDKFHSIIAQELPKEDGEYRMGLYAWTQKKSFKDRFLEYRNPTHYFVQKEECDDEELASLKDIYHNAQIGEFQFVTSKEYEEPEENEEMFRVKSGKKKTVTLITTKQEFIEACENGSENFYFGILQQQYVDFRLFDKELVDALDRIGYTTNAILNSDNPDVFQDDYEDLMTDAQYASSYDQTIYGNKLLKLEDNKFQIFLELYREIIL